MKAIYNPAIPARALSRSAIHAQALARSTNGTAFLAIVAARNIDRYGRYASRNEVSNVLADPRLVRLARQLAAATRAGV